MKKIVFIFVITFLLGAFHTYAQEKSNILLVNGTKIIVPVPDKSFTNVPELIGVSLIPKININSRIFCFYIDSIDNYYLRKYQNKDPKLNKFFSVVVPRNTENVSFNDSLFTLFKNKIINKEKNNTIHLTDNLNFIKQNALNKTDSTDFNKIKSLGCIYDLKDAISSMTTIVSNKNNVLRRRAATNNFLKINNTVIALEIQCYVENPSDIDWLVNISEAWAKSILEANK